MVLIGHSLGGVISRLLAANSGEVVWNAVFDEPVTALTGNPADTAGRKCLCNGLVATIGLAQLRDHAPEPSILTAGDDISRLPRFLPPGANSYTAADVLRFLLTPPTPQEKHLKGNFRLSCQCSLTADTGHVKCHTMRRGQMRIERSATGLPLRGIQHPQCHRTSHTPSLPFA